MEFGEGMQLKEPASRRLGMLAKDKHTYIKVTKIIAWEWRVGTVQRSECTLVEVGEVRELRCH